MKKMMNINSNLIKELRRRTSVSIMECKQALMQAHGDLELAIDNIRKFGLEITVKKSGCVTLSGLIATKISSNKQYGIIVEINCETDFVAKGEIFKEFIDTIIVTALNEKIDDINILNFKFQKKRTDLIAKVRENINIRRFAALKGAYVYCYTHASKIGVLVSIKNHVVTTELIKNIAMHIVAKNPKFIRINDIPKDIILREYHIQKDIVMHFNKSQDILEKIIEGRMNKFFNKIVLTKQNYVLDTNKTVGNVLDEHHLEISQFIRFELGDDDR